jgi:hypothetical protein
MRISQICLIALIMVVPSLLVSCGKQTKLDVGGETINVPVPSGFTPLGTSVPKFKTFIKRFYPPETILIEYYLTDRDFQDVQAGRSKSRERFLSVVVSKQMYGRILSEQNYSTVASVIRSYNGSNFDDIEARANEEKEIKAKKLGMIPHLAMNGNWLGVFLDRNDAIGVASTSLTHKDNGASVKILNLAVTIKIKDRYIQLECASAVSKQTEIISYEKMCSQWVGDIFTANMSDG